ncbi:MAG: SDR family NAD(P)-dependent oxidoreductase [Mariniblastus sp.]
MSIWNNKIVVVTGGSSGLGRSIGNAFAIAGATTVLVARDRTQLDAAVAEAGSNQNLDCQVADVTNEASVITAIDEIVSRHGRIDVWVNNVGKSTRAKFEDCGVEDFEKLIDINFYSAVRCTKAVLKHLVDSSGQVVNIGSLAAKTGWPNVAPYSVSKHALAAYSHQMRIEGPDNVNCLFVCTGPIQRLDSATRYDQQAKGLDEVAKQPGAGVKLKGIPPELLASRIVRSCERRKKDLVMPFSARILFAIAQLSPRIGDFLLRRASKNK